MNKKTERQAEPANIQQRLSILRQRLAKTPQDPVLYNQLGLTYGASGNVPEALKAFDQAVNLNPCYGEALLNQGLALEIAGRHEAAWEAFCRASFLTPSYDEALTKLLSLGHHINKASPRSPWPEPPRPSAVRKLSKILGIARGPEPVTEKVVLKTEAEYRAALDANRTDFQAAIQLASLLESAARFIEAEHFLRFVIAHESAHGVAILALAHLLENLGRIAEAVALLSRSIKVVPPALCGNVTLLRLKQAICDWDGYQAVAERAAAEITANPGCTDPFSCLAATSDGASQLASARAFAATVLKDVQPLTPSRTKQRAQITLGYISADFHQHPVASLVAGLFEAHDRTKFKVLGYALWLDDGSDVRRRIRKGCDRFTSLWDFDARQGAMQIAAENVDILIDLTGYTRNGRPDILAYRPAPIQVNYLGYPGTLGGPLADYAIVDHTVTPAGHDRFYAEKLVYLPQAYQINDRKRPLPRSRARDAYGLPQDGTVFCNFNGNSKYTPDVFKSWMRILGNVPGSSLWLYAGSSESIPRLQAEASACGIDPQRLIFARQIAHEEHLARYAAADLFLDTLPYNGHTTLSDALWMGCPAVTRIGAVFPGRVAASLLRGVDMNSLVVDTLEDYEALAIRLGNSPEDLRALRQKLERERLTCALFDTAATTRYLEAAYERMWDLRAAGKSPESFSVNA